MLTRGVVKGKDFIWGFALQLQVSKQSPTLLSMTTYTNEAHVYVHECMLVSLTLALINGKVGVSSRCKAAHACRFLKQILPGFGGSLGAPLE